ncbi:hypothetical protein ZONE111904_16860 [Zobellia nedashkovskayae]
MICFKQRVDIGLVLGIILIELLKINKFKLLLYFLHLLISEFVFKIVELFSKNYQIN